MKNARKSRSPGWGMTVSVMIFYFAAFLLLALKDYHWQGFALMVLVPLGIWTGTYIMVYLVPVDRLVLALTNILCAMGILILYDTQPLLAYRQVAYYGIGTVGMVSSMILVRKVRTLRNSIWILAACSLVFLGLPLLMGREINGAKNWIFLGQRSVQPSEIVKILMLAVLAQFLSRRQFFPCLCFSAGCLLLLMLQKDLGTALLYYGVTLLLFFIATGNILLTALGLLGGAGASVLGYHMFAHVRRRVAVWMNPWADYENAGYQIAQGLMALASGRWFGVGLGLGSPKTIPVYSTDYIFAVICEQFGLIVGVCILIMYVLLIWRGARIAMAARSSFHAYLCMGATCMLGLQTFVIIGGVIKLIPLTGVTMPFVSAGGSSLLSSMCLVGIIQGVASVNEDQISGEILLAQTEYREIEHAVH